MSATQKTKVFTMARVVGKLASLDLTFVIATINTISSMIC